jgi:hypothetical protein
MQNPWALQIIEASKIEHMASTMQRELRLKLRSPDAVDAAIAGLPAVVPRAQFHAL